MYKTKGFTLVELLAVIVILAIILAIAIPSISGIINSTKKGAFESNAKLIIAGIDYKMLEASVNSTKTAPTTGSILANLTDYGANPANYTIAEITSMNPITITLTSSANSEFGSWTATVTKTTVTFAAK